MSADDDLLALLDAVPNLTVFDGFVEVDDTEKVVRVDLPYVVFYSTPGYDNNERFCGDVGGRVKEFQLTGVGETREQALWVLDKGRSALSRKRLGAALIRRLADNQPIRRDDDFTRPGGEPIFYGVDRYAVAV